MKYTQEQFTELQTEIRRAIAEDDSECCELEYIHDSDGLSAVPVLSNDGIDTLAQIACAQVEPWLESLQPAGHWTTQPPTEPGWYWFEGNDSTVQVINIWAQIDTRELWVAVGGHYMPLAEVEGTWFSEPLRVPGANGGK